MFTGFLKSEFSQENIEFWEACEDFKRLPAKQMEAKAKQIFELYLSVDSPKEVRCQLLHAYAALIGPDRHSV